MIYFQNLNLIPNQTKVNTLSKQEIKTQINKIRQHPKPSYIIFLSMEKRSMEKRSRRSKFAFVLFESLEEAAKVAKTTDGMLMYGWPIVSKVATYGWSNRRVSPVNQRTSFYDEKAQSSRGGGEYG